MRWWARSVASYSSDVDGGTAEVVVITTVVEAVYVVVGFAVTRKGRKNPTTAHSTIRSQNLANARRYCVVVTWQQLLSIGVDEASGRKPCPE
jgi:nicotinamide mononucleotide adenylyltransferase